MAAFVFSAHPSTLWAQSDVSELIDASANGDLTRVKSLIADKVDVNGTPSSGIDRPTALIMASNYGRIDVVKELLASGAKVNARDRGAQTALMRAAPTPDLKLIAEINAKLASDPNYKLLQEPSASGRLDIVKILLAAGADVNARDMRGDTALMGAASSGNIDAVRALIAAGADVNIVDKAGFTAKTLSRGHPEVIAMLLASGATDSKDELEQKDTNRIMLFAMIAGFIAIGLKIWLIVDRVKRAKLART